MNRTHRIVRNRRTGACQAVPETASSSRGGAPGSGLTVGSALAAVALLLGLAAAPAQAAPITWVGPASGSWFTPTYWTGGALPTAVDDVFIISSSTVLLTANAQAARANFVVLGNGGAASLSLIAGGQLFAGRTFVGVGSSGALTVDGANTVLSTGGLLVGFANTGTVTIGNGAKVTTGAGGLGNGYAVEIGLAAGGAGTLNLNAGGTLELGGAGAMPDVMPGATGVFNFAGGTLRVINADLTAAMPATLSGITSTVDTNGYSATLSGVLSGSGALVKTGAGTLSLLGANSYSGGTRIDQGVLAIADSAALGLSSSEVRLSNGELRGTASTTVNNPLTLAGPATVSAATGTTLELAGPLWFNADFNVGAPGQTGIVALASSSGGYSIPGRIQVNYGTLRITGPLFAFLANAAPETAVAAGAVLDLNDRTSSAFSIANLLGSGTVRTGTLNTTTVGVAAGDFSGVVEGAGGITQVGTGTLTLRGANTYTGGTRVSGGTLALAGNGSLSNTGAVMVDAGATFDVQAISDALTRIGPLAGAGTVALGAKLLQVSVSNTSSTFSGSVDGTGSLVKLGNGTLTLSGVNGYTGGTVVSQGTLQLAGGGSLASMGRETVAGGATFDVQTVSGSGTGIGSLAGAGTVALGAKSLQVGANNSSTTFSGGISGTGSLFKQGLGTLTLSGVNTYTGGTRIGAGTLALAGAGALSSTSAVTVDAGATFDVQNIIGSGPGIGSLAGGGTVALGAKSLEVGANDTSTNFAGSIGGTGSLVKQGTGTLTLSGVNGYTGGTRIDAGTLALAGTGALSNTGAVTVEAGATFDVQTITGSAADIGSLAGGGTVALGAKSLQVGANDTSTSFTGSIGGTGSLVKQGTGTFTLSGVNGYTAGTVVSQGALQLTGAGSLAGTGSMTVAAGATFGLSGLLGAGMTIAELSGAGTVQLGDKALATGTNAGSPSTFSGVIEGVGGSLVKQGSGTLWLDGVNIYTGLTTVTAGKLVVGSDATKSGARVEGAVNVSTGATLGGHGSIGGNVAIDSGAHLAPGNSLGTLSIDSNLTLAKGSVLDFEFGTPGSSVSVPGVSDSVVVGGDLALNGATLNINDTGAMGRGLYNLFSYGSTLTQSNGGITLGTVPVGSFALQYLTGSKQVNLISFDPALVLNFWNANGLASPTQLGGGSGTWSVAQPSWTDAQGSVTSVMQPRPGFAIFGGAAGSVVVDKSGGAVSASGLQFASNGYVLSGDALTLVADAASPGPVEVRVGDGSTASAGWNATLANVIAGSDGLAKTGAGTLTLQGANTYTGGTTVRAGALQISSDANLGATNGGLTLDGGALRIAPGTAALVSGRSVTLGAAGGTLDLSTNLLAFLGGIGGKGALTVTGAGGTLAVAMPNTYEGGTTVQGGASISVAGGGTLGTGAVQQQGSGTKIIFTAGSGAGANSYNVGRAGHSDTDHLLSFTQDATAASSKLFVNGAGWQAGGVNSLQFGATSTAATSTIANQGGTVFFQQNASAGSATIVNGDKSLLSFVGAASAGTAQIVNQSGGLVRFEDTASASKASIANAAGGVVDVSGSTVAGGVEFGALSGAGALVLGATQLTLGRANTNDVIAGSISDKGSLFVQPGTGTGGSLVKVGSGTLTLSGANSYTGGTALHQGRLNVGHSQALGTGALSMDDDTTLGFSADGVVLANAVKLTGQNDPVIDTGAFSATLAGAISGGGFITKQGTGTLTLSGANTYTGATSVAQGTLKAGAANTFSAASAHSVAAGATLDLAGFNQGVAALANSGTVSLVGAVAGTTLTVNGNYVGNNGVLKLGTALSGTGPSDRLVINGGTASGKTSVQVTNLGGLGALTAGNGIEVVTAQSGATTTAQTTKDAFSLAGGHVDAGAYEYRLFAADAANAGENWYLRSSTNAVTPPVTPATPVSPSVPVITYRPEASLFASLPSQLRQGNLAMLADLRKRVGDDDVKGTATAPTGSERRAWARVLSTDIDIQQGGAVSPNSKGRLTGFQAGTDLLATSNWRAGLYVGQLDGDARVRGFASGIQNLAVGRNDLRSQYVGVYGTYTADSGFYADAVVQSGRHRYTVEPLLSFGTGGKGNSLLGSIEVGQAFALGGSGWSVEPQLQLIHQHMDLGNSVITGAVVQPQADNGWIARAGVRLKGQLDTGVGTLQPFGRFNVYKTSSGADIARFVNGATNTDIAAPTGGTSSELAGGFTLALSPSTSLYGELGKLWASGGNAKVKSSVNGSLGVRVKW
ncbi:autotransporter-associated beta strand repeat-containing protein [Variovorax sp. J22G73]|uniref:autotransporter-associated beta strand repeat-containing protein n=1 Tax=unclassified Variovorax TaxID=663243 RepID=UPI002576EA73|nr:MULTISPECIES: autotransporter-associated beta strand repeat-containing protein [unclassified Variovorax]MDM0010183.1 autotransporter-associated beta strand repeat-containing protein [Variovorax sp. J22R203]MDM0102955.1 autotransporter-associated beta strand repeat-containing protein [Variovorax sp. J22G73]